VVIDHQGMTVVVRQIVGILARRIVCRVKEGDVVQTGARFGVMKFGSRMDVFLPKGSALHVSVGEKVRGGITTLATLPADARGAASRELASTSA
jgi:phosphatidylserine decarboxylase